MCFATFPTFRGLQQHNSHAHSQRKKRKQHIFSGKTKSKGGKKYQCKVCSKRFDTASNHWIHGFEHKNIWPFHCSECDVQHIRKEKLVLLLLLLLSDEVISNLLNFTASSIT
jgi:rubrerythrin